MLRCYVSYKILYELVTVPETSIMLHVNYASINKKKRVTCFRGFKLERDIDGAEARIQKARQRSNC